MQASSAPSIDESSPRYYGWWVLAASIIGMALSPGPLFFGSLGLLAEGLATEFSWSRAQIMLGLTLVSVAAIPAMPVVGWLIDRYGVRSVLVPSTIGLAALLAVPPMLVGGLGGFYAWFVIAGLLTAGCQSICYVRVISSWFDRRRGLAIGLAASGIGLGFAVVPLIVQAVSTRSDWRAAYWTLALLVSLVSLPLISLVLRERTEVPATSVLTASSQARYVSMAQVLRRREFWLIALGIFVAAVVFNSMVPTIVSLLKDRGMSAQEAAYAASLLGFSVAASRLIVGYLIDFVFAPRVAVAAFGLAACGIGMLALGASGGWVYVAAVLVGVGFGAETDIIGYLVSRYFGQAMVGRVYGLILSAFLIGTGIGPYVAGLAYDSYGTYVPLLSIYALAGLAAAGIFCLLGPYERSSTAAPAKSARLKVAS